MSFDPAAFFTLHRDLPREGPGESSDVAWAARIAQVPPNARICDAACGPGADIPALRAAAPKGHVTAIEKTPHFVEAARAAHGGPAVEVIKGDMATLTGPFDFIWCAGAVYFLGVRAALAGWRAALAPGGAIAFSEPCWFSDKRASEVEAFWAEYPAMCDADGIAAQVRKAGFETLATRRLSDAAWEAYYQPLDLRIARLRAGADPQLNAVLDDAVSEAAIWRAHRRSFGYLLSVVRPI